MIQQAVLWEIIVQARLVEVTENLPIAVSNGVSTGQATSPVTLYKIQNRFDSKDE